MDSHEVLLARLDERVKEHGVVLSRVREDMAALATDVQSIKLSLAESQNNGRRGRVVQVVLPAAGLVGIGMAISESIERLLGK